MGPESWVQCCGLTVVSYPALSRMALWSALLSVRPPSPLGRTARGWEFSTSLLRGECRLRPVE